MSPTSSTLQHLLEVIAVAVPILLAAAWWWHRRRTEPRGRVARGATAVGVVLAVIVGQVAAVGAVGVAVNSQLGYFLDWRSVATVLHDGPGGVATEMGVGASSTNFTNLTGNQRQLVRRQGWFPDENQPPAGNGQYRDYIATGEKSKLHELVVVWVPQGMGSRKDIAKLPAIMNMSGAYGGPSGYLKASSFGQQATTLIKQHKVRPFVGVVPQINVDLPHDTECADYPGGVKAFTWVSHDVRVWAHRTLGISLKRENWADEGISVGGFCAAKLGTAASRDFSASASVEGFFSPETDDTTLNLSTLLRQHQDLRQQNDVAWLIQHQTPSNELKLMVISSPQDPQSQPQYQAFHSRISGTKGLTFLNLPGLPHSNTSMAQVQNRTLPFLMGTK